MSTTTNKPPVTSLRYYDFDINLAMVKSIAETLNNQNKLSHDGPIYYVKVNIDTDYWQVSCVGLECVDTPYASSYSSSEELPESLRDKIRRLSILEPQTPEVAGVGLRVAHNTFWIYG